MSCEAVGAQCHHGAVGKGHETAAAAAAPAQSTKAHLHTQCTPSVRCLETWRWFCAGVDHCRSQCPWPNVKLAEIPHRYVFCISENTLIQHLDCYGF